MRLSRSLKIALAVMVILGTLSMAAPAAYAWHGGYHRHWGHRGWGYGYGYGYYPYWGGGYYSYAPYYGYYYPYYPYSYYYPYYYSYPYWW